MAIFGLRRPMARDGHVNNHVHAFSVIRNRRVLNLKFNTLVWNGCGHRCRSRGGQHPM